MRNTPLEGDDGDEDGKGVFGVYRPLLHEVSVLSDTTMAELHLVAADGRCLVLEAAVGVPELWTEWTAEIPLRLGIGAGAYGEAAVLKRLSVVPDLHDDKCEGFRLVARTVGIEAGWSFPLLARDERVLGTLTVLYDRARTPSADDLQRVMPVVQTLVLLLKYRMGVSYVRANGEVGRGMAAVSRQPVGLPVGRDA